MLFVVARKILLLVRGIKSKLNELICVKIILNKDRGNVQCQCYWRLELRVDRVVGAISRDDERLRVAR
jgi:hypothetical protein